MGQLFRFEFRKLFRQKSFYICGCVLIGLILLTAVTLNMIYSLSQGNMEAGGVTVSASDDGFLYTGIYMLVGAVSSSNFTIVLAVFLSLFVCSDYTNGTLKNIIARGYSRTRIYAVKYMVSLAATTVYTIVCWLTGFLAGTAFWKVGSLSGTTGDLVITLLLQLLGNFAYTSLFFLIAVLFKKTGGSIAVGIIGPLVLSMIISLADTLTHKKSFDFADYWLDNCMYQTAADLMASNMITRCLVCFIIYAVLFYVISIFVGKRIEV